MPPERYAPDHNPKPCHEMVMTGWVRACARHQERHELKRDDGQTETQHPYYPIMKRQDLVATSAMVKGHGAG